MGRKRKDRANKRSKCIMVRVTPAERKRLEAEAKKLGISLAAVLLRAWQEGED